MTAPLRLGLLGAARIAPAAVVRPSRDVHGVEAFAVAARDPGRARAFASRHGLARVHESYDSMLADPAIDAIYNALPNGLHAKWTIRALEAGKPVLCEKPLAANADEAQRMCDTAEKTGLALMEAFHWRYHPLAARMQQVVRSGRLGRVEHLEVDLCVPIPIPGDIRFRLDLAGGSVMDLGCYCVSILRHLVGAEPEVVHASSRLWSPGIDRYTHAELRFPGELPARFKASMLAFTPPRLRLRVRGSEGEMTVTNPLLPHVFHRLRIRTAQGTTTETEPGRTSYTHQLEAFVGLVRHGTPVPTDAADGVRNMRVIDAVYEAAGLGRRVGV